MAQPARAHDPLRLDVERFAREGGRLAGEWPLAGMDRLVACCHADGKPGADGQVVWAAQGEMRRSGGGLQPWLLLGLRSSVQLTCQRCLGAVDVALEVGARFRFVDGEARAAQEDAESDEDVLALSRSLDLHALAEDELLLALPLVPRHEACPEPLLAPAAEPAEDAPLEGGPFAALAGLKRATH